MIIINITYLRELLLEVVLDTQHKYIINVDEAYCGIIRLILENFNIDFE